MKTILAFLLGGALMYACCLDVLSTVGNTLKIEDNYYKLDMPEETALISTDIAKPNTMVSWISNDTLHFGFKLSLQSKENKSKYRFDQHIDLNNRTP